MGSASLEVLVRRAGGGLAPAFLMQAAHRIDLVASAGRRGRFSGGRSGGCLAGALRGFWRRRRRSGVPRCGRARLRVSEAISQFFCRRVFPSSEPLLTGCGRPTGHRRLVGCGFGCSGRNRFVFRPRRLGRCRKIRDSWYQALQCVNIDCARSHCPCIWPVRHVDDASLSQPMLLRGVRRRHGGGRSQDRRPD